MDPRCDVPTITIGTGTRMAERMSKDMNPLGRLDFLLLKHLELSPCGFVPLAPLGGCTSSSSEVF